MEDRLESGIETVNIDEQTEEVERYDRYDFPVATIRRYATCAGDTIYFSAKAKKYMGGKRFVRICRSTNYLIFQFADEKGDGCFTLRERGKSGMSVGLPSALKNAGLKSGVYKLYRCDGGMCIKRYEPLTN